MVHDVYSVPFLFTDVLYTLLYLTKNNFIFAGGQIQSNILITLSFSPEDTPMRVRFGV